MPKPCLPKRLRVSGKQWQPDITGAVIWHFHRRRPEVLMALFGGLRSRWPLDGGAKMYRTHCQNVALCRTLRLQEFLSPELRPWLQSTKGSNWTRRSCPSCPRNCDSSDWILHDLAEHFVWFSDLQFPGDFCKYTSIKSIYLSRLVHLFVQYIICFVIVMNLVSLCIRRLYFPSNQS